MIKKFINPSGVYAQLLNSINNNEKISVFGLFKNEKLTTLNECGKFICFVAQNQACAVEYKQLFEDAKYRVGVLTTPLDYSLNILSENIVSDMSITLNGLINNDYDVLIITPEYLTMPLVNKEYLQSNSISVEKGDDINVTSFVNKLISLKYERVENATQSGQFSVKGEVINVYSTMPFRIEVDWDKISSIKEYNPTTLLSGTELHYATISCLKYLSLDLDNIKSKYNSELTKANLLDCNSLDKIMWFLPFANNVENTIFDYLPSDSVVAINDAKMCFDAYSSFVKDNNTNINSGIKENKYNSNHKKLLLKLNVDFGSFGVVAFGNIQNANRFFAPQKVFNIKTEYSNNYNLNNQLLIYDLKKCSDYTVIIYAKSNDGATRIKTLLDASAITYNECKLPTFALAGQVNIIPTSSAFSGNFTLDKLLIISTEQLFGVAKKQTHSSDLVTQYTDFLPQTNDIVVHSVYGIGKCLGVQNLKYGVNSRDYVIIEYLHGDKLYVPVENIDNVSKYIGSVSPKLNKLGGGEFLKQKAIVKEHLKQLAFSLVELYKVRESQKGFVYSHDDELMHEFENSFSFVETPDQISAITDVKKDMESGKIMDRLICGDVGFGKTEVALRAAFKTICNGKQVAFLCPTTILSEQHYNTCVSRLKDFGCSVEVLNRFNSESKTDSIIKRLSEGTIDMVVGTHKLLNSKIKYHNLGLLILDEEQKFGVGDKEKIKNLKKQINVLTLSATPIPRTLHMAMSGIRDISIIQTPPVSRLSTNVRVTDYSLDLVKNAIDFELNRMGQVLIVYNKVESISAFASTIKKLVGNEVKIGIAHGQMQQKELEDAIFNLYNGTTQILIATTLIENGIDLPNANTLIVVNADELGLSQLYQLKGRIGRSDKESFAYFTFDSRKNISEVAVKRLEAINQFTTLGSGYKVALKDLEIRGAGNVLGVEQSGHMEKIGYAMYLQLLSQAVGEVKGEKIKDKYDVKIETTMNAFISSDYITDYNARINAYLLISKIENIKQLQNVEKELTENFGDIPSETITLCKIAYIKNMASNYDIQKIVITPSNCGIYLQSIKCMEVFSEGLKYFDKLVLDMSNLPIINVSGNLKLSEVLDYIISFLEYIGTN